MSKYDDAQMEIPSETLEPGEVWCNRGSNQNVVVTRLFEEDGLVEVADAIVVPGRPCVLVGEPRTMKTIGFVATHRLVEI